MKTMHWRWISNAVLLIIACVLLILFEVGVLPTYKGGFYCNDPALSFVPGDETVPDEMLFIVSILGTITVMVFNEMIRHAGDKDGYSFSKFLQDMNLVYVWFRGFFLVMIIGLSITEFIKFTVGTPRPTFLEVCVPDKAINCTTGQYIEHYECTGTKYSHHTILDNNRSFLSGHSMTSLYTGLYLFWYLQQRCGGPWLWSVMQQLAAILWGVVASLSRIIDHRHHWWDVLAGDCFAGILTIYSVWKICENFKVPPKTSQFFRYLQENYDKEKNDEIAARNNIV